MLDPLSRAITPGLGIVGSGSFGSGDDRLFDAWGGATRGVTQGIMVGWHKAPAKYVELFGVTSILDDLTSQPTPAFAFLAWFIVQKDGRDTRTRDLWPVESAATRIVGEEVAGNWQEDAGAIAGAVIRRYRTAMTNTIQGGEGCIDDIPARSPSGIGDETDSARIVLESGVV